MLNRENMGETCGKVADLFGKTREGLTVREAARALKSPENTIDFHVRMLLAAGNLVKVGKAALEDLGRPGYVYADRKHVSTSKAWIAKNEREREARTPKKAKPASAQKSTQCKGSAVAKWYTAADGHRGFRCVGGRSAGQPDQLY